VYPDNRRFALWTLPILQSIRHVSVWCNQGIRLVESVFRIIHRLDLTKTFEVSAKDLTRFGSQSCDDFVSHSFI
jgi:hypothetical protein